MREELWFLEDLRRHGAYWREAALALPAADVETVRLVRYLLQRGQILGANEAEAKAREAEAAAAKSAKSAKKGRTSRTRTRAPLRRRSR
jgi:hypothetical protein